MMPRTLGVVVARAGAPCLTERMRAAALRAQAAALEMQDVAAEFLALANEVEDWTERQDSALVHLRGPIELPPLPSSGMAHVTRSVRPDSREGESWVDEELERRLDPKTGVETAC